MPHFGQKPSVRPGCPSRDRPTGRPAVRAVPFLLRDLRILHDRLGGVDLGRRRNAGETGAQSGRPEPLRARAHSFGDLGTSRRSTLGAQRGRLQPAGASRCLSKPRRR